MRSPTMAISVWVTVPVITSSIRTFLTTTSAGTSPAPALIMRVSSGIDAMALPGTAQGLPARAPGQGELEPPDNSQRFVVTNRSPSHARDLRRPEIDDGGPAGEQAADEPEGPHHLGGPRRHRLCGDLCPIPRRTARQRGRALTLCHAEAKARRARRADHR